MTSSLVEVFQPGDLVALDEGEHDYDELLDLIGERRFVLLGEASHGSHEFYRERSRITQRLIEEKGFTVVAAEADWPDASRVNSYVMGRSEDPDAKVALEGFERFPSWMWRNKDVVEFVEWLRTHNQGHIDEQFKTGFYGLDLYSLHTSMEAVITYLSSVDPDAAIEARERYSCFDHVRAGGSEYGRAVTLDHMVPCENEVVAQLVAMQYKTAELLARDGWTEEERLFSASQNARLVHNAERYYRMMYSGSVSSWNIRDQHMAETLSHLVDHRDRHFGPTKVVVWAHNSHVGDARSTQLGSAGELNVGQLVRTTWGDESFLVGFTTDHGRVTAASNWGDPAERKQVRPALHGSYEELFHLAQLDRFLVPLGQHAPFTLERERLERAIGVIYRPETERHSHWFSAHLPSQFDAVIHIDHTTAVEPLERTASWDMGEPPETYPSGL